MTLPSLRFPPLKFCLGELRSVSNKPSVSTSPEVPSEVSPSYSGVPESGYSRIGRSVGWPLPMPRNGGGSTQKML